MNSIALYPDFVPNQVLTNTQLNQLRTYLDEQSRLTRVRLVGTGIVCGLTWLRDAKHHVTIDSGFGISSSGYLIELAKTTYDRFRPYTDPHQDEEKKPVYAPWRKTPGGAQIPLIELIGSGHEEEKDFRKDAANPPKPLTGSGLDLNAYVVVLYLEMDEVDLKSCLVTSCNNRGTNVELRVRALLVQKGARVQLPPCPHPDITTEVPLVDVPRFHRPPEGRPLTSIGTASELNGTYGRIVKSCRPVLGKAIEKAYDRYGRYLDLDRNATDLALSVLDEVLSDAEADDAFDQYHYDFARDVACAYNEFVRDACGVLGSCAHYDTFPRHLFLGARGVAAGYRHRFVPAPVRNVSHHDLRRVERLFSRMLTIIMRFDPPGKKEAIRATPSHTTHHRLGERAVPFYYEWEGEGELLVKKEWQPALCCTYDPLWSYLKAGSDADLDLDCDRYSFVRLEGHLQHGCQSAHGAIESLRDLHNLDFNVLTLHLEKNTAGESDARQEMAETLEKMGHLLRKSRVRKVQDLFGPLTWEGDPVAAFREKMEELRNVARQSSLKWTKLRLEAAARQDISQVQADYLLQRSTLLAVYQPIFRYLDRVLGFIYALPVLLREGLEAFLDALKGGGEVEPVEEGEFPRLAIKIYYGILLEVANLRDDVHELVHYLLPREVTRFDHELLAKRHQDILRTLLDMRLLPVFAALYGAAETRRPDLPRPSEDDLAGGSGDEAAGENLKAAFEEIKEQMTSLNPFSAGVITTLLKTLEALPHLFRMVVGLENRRAQVGLATVDRAFNRMREEAHFATFAKHNPGMEHLAGVRARGGDTFILVCDRPGDEATVVADFTLHGRACCCPKEIATPCIPPVAVPEYSIAVRPEKEGAAVVDIDLLDNDFSLNDDLQTYRNEYQPRLRIERVDSKTEQGGAVIPVEDSGGTVRYIHETPDFYGLDSFTYTVVDEGCDSRSTGRVVVAVLPFFEFWTTGTVTGIIIDSETKEPLPDATVTIEDTDFTAVTDDEGTFTIPDVPTGRYSVTVTKEEYQQSGTDIVLVANETENVEVALSPVDKPLGTIKVEVLSIFEKPIQNALVRVLDEDSAVIVSGRTDGTGSAAFDVPAPGEYTVTVKAAGFEEDSRQISLEAGETGATQFAIEPSTGSAQGTVTDAGTEEPVPGASVVVRETGLGSVTGVDGRYTLKNVPPGTYTLRFTVIGYDSVDAELEIEAGGTAEIDVALQPSVTTGTVTGSVKHAETGEGIASATVTLQGTGHGARTDANGAFVLRLVPAGNYTLAGSAIGFHAASTPVTVKADASVSAELAFSPAVIKVTLTVLAQTEAGKAISGATVRLLRDGEQVGKLATDASGMAVFEGVESGTYELEALAEGFESVAREVDIPTTDTTEVLLLTPSTGSIEGVVTDAETGRPLQGVTVVLPETDGKAMTTEEGLYGFAGLQPGPHVLGFSRSGYSSMEIEVTVEAGQKASGDAALQANLEPAHGQFIYCTRSDDPVSIVVDDEMVVDNLIGGTATPYVPLQAGAPGVTVLAASGEALLTTSVNDVSPEEDLVMVLAGTPGDERFPLQLLVRQSASRTAPGPEQIDLLFVNASTEFASVSIAEMEMDVVLAERLDFGEMTDYQTLKFAEAYVLALTVLNADVQPQRFFLPLSEEHRGQALTVVVCGTGLLAFDPEGNRLPTEQG